MKNWREAFLVVSVAAILGFLVGEAPLVAVIVGLVLRFGLWGGFLAFSFLCGLGGVLLVPVYERLSSRFSRWFGGGKSEGPKGPRHKLIARAARVGRPLGALVNSVLLGPIFGIPVFRALEYRGVWLYAWVLIGSLIFGAVWVLGIYGRLATIIIGG